MQRLNSYCQDYCGPSCVDGSCPLALYDEYMERGYDCIHSCDECMYNEGSCEDCYFYKDNVCIIKEEV